MPTVLRHIALFLVVILLTGCAARSLDDVDASRIKLRVLVSVQYISEEDPPPYESANTYAISIDGTEVLRQSFSARGFGHDLQPEPILEIEPGRRTIEFLLVENGATKRIRGRFDEDFALTVAYMSDKRRLEVHELPFTFVRHIE